MPSHILSIDQGTTSSRAIVFDARGRPRHSAQREYPQLFPNAKSGWVEHDPEDIWESQLAVLRQAFRASGLKRSAIAAVGITNQRETTIVWDRKTGRPIHNAIVWQDRRTADECARLKSAGAEALVRKKTGLVIDPYFSATKIAWILDHIRGARKRASRGELCFGTVDSWLVWKLTGGLHLTDVTNASRTMLFDIYKGEWDDELLELFRIPRSMLPEVRSSSEEYGTISLPRGPGRELSGLTIAGIAGDQQAALFGQACISPGMIKNTYGTGCFMLQNVGDKPARLSKKSGLVQTIAWKLGPLAPIEYALEGGVFIGGAVVQWLRDGLGIIKESSDIRALATSVDDTGGIVFVPALAGLGAPHWDPYARGLIIGLSRATTAAHIARAAVEGMAFQVADLLDAMNTEARKRGGLKELRVDGGASVDELLMQFQADILQIPVVRPRVTETTALGAALLAGRAVGMWKSDRSMADLWKPEKRFTPRMKPADARTRRARWNEAVSRARNWAKDR